MSYQSRNLRGEVVWAKLRTDGELAKDAQGRVEIFYRPGGKPYRASATNLESVDKAEIKPDAEFIGKPAPAAPAEENVSASDAAPAAIIVYTDGACTGNPGPMGIGVVVLDGKARLEHGEFLGDGTNNIAELTAILRGIELSPPGRPLRVHTDSSYSIGVLSLGWKAKANRELILAIKDTIKQRGQIKFVKVAGHAGIPENERCDELARQAVIRRK